MANTDWVHGLRLVGKLGGGVPSVRRYWADSADSTAMFIGDLVKISGTSDATGQYASVAQCAAGDAAVGVLVGVDQVDGVAIGSTNLNRRHRPASTAMFVMVCDDPLAIYEIQEDSDGGALAATDIGLNADVIVAAGNATTGNSGMELDTSTKNTTATLVLRILGLVPSPDNAIGANSKVLVKINNHQMLGGTGTAGV